MRSRAPRKGRDSPSLYTGGKPAASHDEYMVTHGVTVSTLASHVSGPGFKSWVRQGLFGQKPSHT